MLCLYLIPFATRSQNIVVIVAYDASTFFLRRCRWCVATVEVESLYAAAWGQAALREASIPVRRAGWPHPAARWTHTVFRRKIQRQRRRGVKKTCRWHVFSLRSRRLCRRSIHLSFHSKTWAVVQLWRVWAI